MMDRRIQSYSSRKTARLSNGNDVDMSGLNGNYKKWSQTTKVPTSIISGRRRRTRDSKRLCFILILTIILLSYLYCFHVFSSSLLQTTPKSTLRTPTSIVDHQKRKRVFICITGQASRLVLNNQIDTLLNPIQQQGYEPDVALVLTETTYTTNSMNGKSTNKQDFQHARQRLVDPRSNFSFPCLSQKAIVVEEKPKINEQYLKQMDKKEESPEWQRHRVENHARQYETLAQCSQYITKQPLNYYEFGIRIREDVSFEKPLNIQHILPMLFRNKRTILTSDCRTHGGMNDRLAIFTMDAAKDYFTLPSQFFFNEHYSVVPSVKNPETYLLSTYTMNSLNVKFTKKLRGLIKYVANDQGQVVPAQKEEIRHCPRGVKHFLTMAYKYATLADT